MLSIIIPTLNEEKYLPKLLKSIKKQTFKDYEIIVSDANSKDRTREIALKYGCKVVNGGIPGVARNNGAKVAKGDYLLFLDADVKLEEDFILRNLNELKEKGLGIAGCYIKPLEKKLFYKFICTEANFIMKLAQYSFPISAGCTLFSKKKYHDEVKGFSKEPIFCEDRDYARRTSKIAKFRMLRSKPVIISMRRFERFGKFRTLFTYLLVNTLCSFHPVKYNKFKYKFGHF